MDYTTMTIEEIDEQLLALSAEKESVRTKMLELTAARDSKLVHESWSDKVANMTPTEVEALKALLNVQVAGVEGIESQEAVNELSN
jgi:hypothetical protein